MRAVFHKELGFWNGDPASILPLLPVEHAKRYVALIGRDKSSSRFLFPACINSYRLGDVLMLRGGTAPGAPDRRALSSIDI